MVKFEKIGIKCFAGGNGKPREWELNESGKLLLNKAKPGHARFRCPCINNTLQYIRYSPCSISLISTSFKNILMIGFRAALVKSFQLNIILLPVIGDTVNTTHSIRVVEKMSPISESYCNFLTNSSHPFKASSLLS